MGPLIFWLTGLLIFRPKGLLTNGPSENKGGFLLKFETFVVQKNDTMIKQIRKGGGLWLKKKKKKSKINDKCAHICHYLKFL